MVKPRPQRWIGLDIGRASIKLVALEPAAGGPAVGGTGARLAAKLVQELPTASPGTEAPAVDRAGWLQAAFKELQPTEVHLVVGGPEVAIRRVKVPPMSKAELDEAVKWQVKDELPFAVQDAVLDCEVVGEVWDKDIRKLDVLVGAASAKVVHDAIALVEGAGAKVASVLPVHLALAYPFRKLAASGSLVIVEFGAQQTHVVVVKDGYPRIARDIPVGSEHLTQALVGVTASERGDVALDAGKAEAIKREYGVPAETVEGTTPEGLPLTQVSALMRSVLENLLVELARFLDFYKMQADSGGITQIRLCGGGANLKGLQPFLSQGLGIPVQVEEQPELTAAFGAALAHGEALDLTPLAFRRARRRTESTQQLRRLAMICGAVAVSLYVALHAVAWRQSRGLRAQQRAWEQVEAGYGRALALASEARQLHGMMAAAQAFKDRQPVWGGILKEVGRVIPPGLVLTEMTIGTPPGAEAAGLQLRLRGTSASAGELGQFLSALEDSEFFRDVELVNSQMQGGMAGTSFDVVCGLE